jgi:hypothetical protein
MFRGRPLAVTPKRPIFTANTAADEHAEEARVPTSVAFQTPFAPGQAPGLFPVQCERDFCHQFFAQSVVPIPTVQFQARVPGQLFSFSAQQQEPFVGHRQGQLCPQNTDQWSAGGGGTMFQAQVPGQEFLVTAPVAVPSLSHEEQKRRARDAALEVTQGQQRSGCDTECTVDRKARAHANGFNQTQQRAQERKRNSQSQETAALRVQVAHLEDQVKALTLTALAGQQVPHGPQAQPATDRGHTQGRIQDFSNGGRKFFYKQNIS